MATVSTPVYPRKLGKPSRRHRMCHLPDTVRAYSLRYNQGNLQVLDSISLGDRAVGFLRILKGKMRAAQAESNTDAMLIRLPKRWQVRVIHSEGAKYIAYNRLHKSTPRGEYRLLKKGGRLEISVTGKNANGFSERIDILSYDGTTVELKEGVEQQIEQPRFRSRRLRRHIPAADVRAVQRREIRRRRQYRRYS